MNSPPTKLPTRVHLLQWWFQVLTFALRQSRQLPPFLGMAVRMGLRLVAITSAAVLVTAALLILVLCLTLWSWFYDWLAY